MVRLLLFSFFSLTCWYCRDSVSLMGTSFFKCVGAEKKIENRRFRLFSLDVRRKNYPSVVFAHLDLCFLNTYWTNQTTLMFGNSASTKSVGPHPAPVQSNVHHYNLFLAHNFTVTFNHRLIFQQTIISPWGLTFVLHIFLLIPFSPLIPWQSVGLSVVTSTSEENCVCVCVCDSSSSYWCGSSWRMLEWWILMNAVTNLRNSRWMGNLFTNLTTVSVAITLFLRNELASRL